MANISSSNGIEKRPKLQFRDANEQLFPAWKRYRFDVLYKPVSEKTIFHMVLKALFLLRICISNQMRVFLILNI